MYSKETARGLIHSFFSTLIDKDVERIGSLCDEGVRLIWGPYVFEGRQEITRWSKEFLTQFSCLKYKETEFKMEGNTASEKMILEITTQKGQTGVIRCEGIFKFKDKKIEMIKFLFSAGVILIEKEESVGLNLHKIKVNYKNKRFDDDY